MRALSIKLTGARSLTKHLLLFGLLLSLCCLSTNAQLAKWHVPTYKGLTLGKSRKADVVWRFGRPDRISRPEDEYDNPVKSFIVYIYENVGGFDGRTEISMKTRNGVITDISLVPNYERPLPLADVLKKYRSDYIERSVGLGPCPTPKEIRNYKPDPIDERPAFLVYPRKGVIVMVGENKSINYIDYALSCP
jgi:hypothetical protein